MKALQENTMSPFSHSSRREFLKVAGGTAAAALTAASLTAGTPSSIDVMKVGAIGLDYSFWQIWADLLSPKGRRLGTSVLRMRPAYIWDKDVKRAQQFAQQYECEVVDRYDAMVGKVDAVLNGDLNTTPFQHLLLRPYIEAGIPCFLQRHWSDTLVHMDAMLDLAAKHGTPLMATVPFEHYGQADVAVQQLKNVGEIEAVFATARIPDEPHFHLPYLMMKILGYDVDTISMNTDDVRKTGYFNVDYVYPKTDQRKPFVVSMQGAGQDVFWFNIMGQRGNVSANMPELSDYFTRFFGQLLDIQRTFEKRALYQPLDVIRKKFQCLQAAYYSRLERNGAAVKLGTVPADWPIPAWTPGAYTAADFKA
jgi:hypothetical protein